MSSSFRADLHCHSYYSDGSDSPEQLILAAKAIGLSGLAITDHDTVEAYDDALDIAAKHNFPLLTGIEFSASYKNEPVHILAYGFSHKHPAIVELCKRHTLRRKDRNRRILQALKKLGIIITEEELENVRLPQEKSIKRTIGRPHIAILLMEKGVVSNFKEAFNKYLGEGKAAFDPGERITVEETIRTIHEAKALAVIAHPHLIEKASILRALLKMRFEGLEAYYAKMEPDREQRFVKLAKEHNWLITGGSDYHGLILKPQNPLGSSWVNEETFNKLYRIYQSNVLS